MENIIVLVLIGVVVIQNVWYNGVINKLLNRIMARHYEEFKYYEDKYPKDLREVDKLREENRDRERDEDGSKVNASEFEEQWGEEELDNDLITKEKG